MTYKNIFKTTFIYILFILITVFLLHGCSLVSFGHPKEAREEKQIFGFLEGYNHRIKEAQGYLIEAGFNPGQIDGKMHRSTRKAVKDFQKANDLKITGFIGSETWQKLGSYKKRGEPLRYYSSSLEGIKELQQALENSGFDPGPIDGKMGSKTRKAIIDFQKAKGLPASGTIDTKTIEALNKYFTKK